MLSGVVEGMSEVLRVTLNLYTSRPGLKVIVCPHVLEALYILQGKELGMHG